MERIQIELVDLEEGRRLLDLTEREDNVITEAPEVPKNQNIRKLLVDRGDGTYVHVPVDENNCAYVNLSIVGGGKTRIIRQVPSPGKQPVSCNSCIIAFMVCCTVIFCTLMITLTVLQVAALA